MHQMRQYARTTLFTALMLGLSLVWALKQHGQHGHHATHAVVQHQHLPGTNRRSGSRNGRNLTSSLRAAGDHAEVHVLPTPGSNPGMVALPSAALILFTPELIPVPFATADVVALGSAARAPGSPRGPPSIS